MDSSLPGSAIHGIFQASVLEWAAFPSPGDLPDPGIKPTSPALAGKFFTTEPKHDNKCLLFHFKELSLRKGKNQTVKL